jgi:hypothetical protein
VGVMANHQFSNLAFWKTIEASLGLPHVAAHTLLFGSFVVLSLLLFLMSSTLSAAASQEGLGQNMALYGLGFIPLAFAGHLAHISHEFLGDGLFVLLAYGRRVFNAVFFGVPLGSQEFLVEPFIHPSVVTILKVLLVLAGSFGSLVALLMIARKANARMAFARALPHLALLGFFTVAYLGIFVASTEGDAAPAAEVSAAPATNPSPASATSPTAPPAKPAGRPLP